MKNLSQADIEKIRSAYDNIESPCHWCDFREDHYCTAYGQSITEDSQDVFIPCPDCENSMAQDLFT